MDADLIIFGGTGDLAKRSLLPALHSLYCQGALGAASHIISASRRDVSSQRYRELMTPDNPPEDWQGFAQLLDHESVDVAAARGFSELREHLQASQASKRILYLSTLPEYFVSAVRGAHESGLITPETTVIVEKPVGTDLESARKLNQQLSEVFDEQQILRIDHYLGKEKVRALADKDFRALGGATAIEITLSESQDIGTRGEFYDRTGALRDMVQNHLLQLLCLVAAEPGAKDLNAAKVEILEKLRVRGMPVWGQFDGYLEVQGVEVGSHTETYVAMEVRLDLDAWRDTPFLLRTGKCLREKRSQLVVGGKAMDLSVPGENAYEALLRDALRGDRSKFVGREEVEAAWRFIDGVVAMRTPNAPLSYAGGTWGPEEADALALNSGACEWKS